MKFFANRPFVLFSMTNLLLITRITATSSDNCVHGNQNEVQLLTRQDDPSSSEPGILLNDSSIYPSFPPTDPLPESTSTSSPITFSVLRKSLVQDFTCNNCSAQGDISLQGDVSSEEESSGWSLVAAANGFSAHVEFNTSLRPRADRRFSIPIKTIELESFGIGDIVVITPKIVIEVAGHITATVDADISGGFDITVPNGASITIAYEGVKNFSASLSGFNETQVTQLPFSANISNPEGLVGIGLRFNYILAVSPVSDFLPAVYAGVYAFVPALVASFSPVSNVNANCQNITASETDAALQAAFPNLLYIEPSAEASVGATFGVDTLGDGITFSNERELAYVEFALPNQCLEWSPSSESGGVFVAPDVEALTGGDSATGTGSATGTAKGGAGSTPTGTSGSSPSRTSGAAAETSSNRARNLSAMSNETGLGWAVGLLTLVLVLAGAVL